MFEWFSEYERFTDRARKVMQLANQEAQRFNHEYIGTEHILLGLVKEGSGVAANVLKNLDIDLRKIRLEVEKIVQTGPDMVVMGRLPKTPRAKKVIEYAIEEARGLNHNYIGTEHLLLGLIREEEGVGAQVLMNLGLTLRDLRLEVLNMLRQATTTEEDHCSWRAWARLRLKARRSQNIVAVECNIAPSPTRTPAPAANDRIESLEQELYRLRVVHRETSDAAQQEIRSLRQQLWNVRIVLGASAGALAGILLAAQAGVLPGLILGSVVAALGRRIPAALAGGVTGMLLGSAHLLSDGGALVGALLGALAGLQIVEIGGSPGRPWLPQRK
jgi:hypothetical protein